VPEDKGAVTLLVVPESWLGDMKTTNPTIEAGVNQFFRRSRTSRISEVILTATVFVPLEKGIKHYGAYRRYRNPHCAEASGIPPIPSSPIGRAPNWKSIVDTVNKAFPVLGS
jgi:hypothetical protein